MRLTFKSALVVATIWAMSTASWGQDLFQTELTNQKAESIKEIADAVRSIRSVQPQAQRRTQFAAQVNSIGLVYLNMLLSSAAGIVEIHSQQEVDQLVAAAEQEVMATIQSSRVDKQIGSDAKSGGLGLTQKGGIPALLGIALQNGAVQQEINNTTLTFTGNLGGVFDAFQSGALVKDDPLRKVGFSLSFDTARGSTPSLFTGSSQQLSSYSFRYVIVNRRDVSLPQYRMKWESLVPSAQAIATSMGAVASRLISDPNYQLWLDETASRIDESADTQLESVLAARFQVLEQNILKWYQSNPAFAAPIQNFRKSLDSNLRDRDEILKAAAKGFIATAEYTNYRRVNEPDQSNFRFISEGQLRDGKIDVTGNASLTMNHKPVAGQGRLRDFQFAAQLDFPLATLPSIGNFVLSASGRYERLLEPADITINGVTVAGIKGDIAYAQGKLTIPVAKGVKVPLSVTVANRTELVKERDVRALVGLTFDLDAIYSVLKP